MGYVKTVEKFMVEVGESYLTTKLPTKWSCSVTEEDGNYKILFCHYKDPEAYFSNCLVIAGFGEHWSNTNMRVLMNQNDMKDDEFTLKSTTGRGLHLEITVYAQTESSDVFPLLGVDLMDEKIDHDHVLNVGGMKLYVKKSILSLHSAYFERHFNGNFKEAAANETPIQEVNSFELKTMLQLLYPGTHSVTDDNVGYLWTLADRFAIPSVANMCEQYLCSINGKCDQWVEVIKAYCTGRPIQIGKTNDCYHHAASENGKMN